MRKCMCVCGNVGACVYACVASSFIGVQYSYYLDCALRANLSFEGKTSSINTKYSLHQLVIKKRRTRPIHITLGQNQTMNRSGVMSSHVR